MTHLDRVALRKIGDVSEGFRFWRFEKIGTDATLLSGGPTRTLARGPRKGEARCGKITHKAVVTDEELRVERTRYEAETGNCAECQGSSQVFDRWDHIEGVSYRKCRICRGTGKAVPE